MYVSFFDRPKVRLLVVASLAAPVFLLAGCANKSASSSVYSYGQAQREQIVRLGTVVSVRAVTIQEDQNSGVGTVGGAALGGVAASSIGGGRGSILASIGGAILGETRVVAQEADVPLSAGQRVRMLSGNGPTRVVPL